MAVYRQSGSPQSLLHGAILLVRYRLQPFVGGVLSGNLDRKVAEPLIRSRAVPVLNARRDSHDISRNQLLCGLAPLLVPALAVNAYEYLPAALVRVVDVPVIPAGGLESHVGDENGLLRVGEGLQPGVPGEVLRERRVRLALPSALP